MQIEIAQSSGFMDTNVPENEKLYGYHRLEDPLVQTIKDDNLIIMPQSEYVSGNKEVLLPPEPLDDPVLIGRHDVPGVSYND